MSEPGNLYATFLFSIAEGPQAAAQVSFVAALAVHDMVVALPPRLVSPHQVAERRADRRRQVLRRAAGSGGRELPPRIAIGCGVNVAHAPEGTPYPVTALGADLALDDGAARTGFEA